MRCSRRRCWRSRTKLRDRRRPGLSEAVATFGLIATILGTAGRRPDTTPLLVGLYITAAYWFTASTSFANPAVTVARSLSDTFAGIAPSSVPLFIAAQLAGALAALLLFGWLLGGSAPGVTEIRRSATEFASAPAKRGDAPPRP